MTSNSDQPPRPPADPQDLQAIKGLPREKLVRALARLLYQEDENRRRLERQRDLDK